MKKIKITPKTRRAKNRIKEHGKVMLLRQEKPDKILVESLGNTFSIQGEKQKWLGWFTAEEINWISV